MQMLKLAILMATLLLAGAGSAEEQARPGFASCAAYYFLAARGHGMQDYDRLYSAGEFSLNEAAGRHGRPAAEQRMGEASRLMMTAIGQDWRNIKVLDDTYGASCETLLRDTNYTGF
jgi:hypothetical protein